MNRSGKTILVIGNGFDVDLGLNTRYSDFAGDIGFFPENQKSNLFQYIKKQSLCPNWGGIEASMEEYALLPLSEHTFEEDREYFYSLKINLIQFLHNKLFGSPNHRGEFDNAPKINEDSCAYHLCYRLLHTDSLDSIITFNYTDICKYLEQIGKAEDEPEIEQIKLNYISKRTFVHRIKDEMVLGISGDIKLKDTRYDFLKKTHQAVTPSISQNLSKCDNVIFFGLSFSKPDHSYFSEYFNSIANQEFEKEPKNIYIVSRNDDSFKKCMLEIESMLNGDLTHLMNKNSIIQINTDRGWNSKGLSQLIDLFSEIR